MASPAWVEIGIEYTRNLGNFENIKLRTGAGRPLNEGEHPGDALDKVYGFVSKKLIEYVNDITEDVDKAK